MKEVLFGIVVIGILSGFLLFRRKTIPNRKDDEGFETISVIIPARNEEKNLPFLLQSLQNQTIKPLEIIVVDDHSEDRTKEIAREFNVTCISVTDPPKGWTGKTWAVWNGYLHSNGEILAFFDADIRLEPDALRVLISARKHFGSVLSVIPYHTTEKFYEKLAMIVNLLSVFTFTSPFETNSTRKGLYGSCIITTRKDYEKIGGHKSIQSEILDDLSLGAKFQQANIPVTNFIGKPFVSFRMYPNGLKSEIEGFAKSAAIGATMFTKKTLFFIILWLIGLFTSELFLLFYQTTYFYPLLIGYLLYMIQIYLFNRYIGQFGIIQPLIHSLSALFFLIVIFYSFYQSKFRKSVLWKGRYVSVGRGGMR
ncbi:glycosyltransferase [Fervidibacillus halotolerans]|uniref:4,4'-diaponeurosporenoate glycosyltransferase n=1 Tax=Fervidibacillus halotolerans TaxID=2980027 RepID=A0A9E8M1B0_9BACI|nr:glycosyltransferase [Fervidibacillus halotolerans]WAA13414.1 glycosyltransferase [Fervidibacillus halotolerans]